MIQWRIFFMAFSPVFIFILVCFLYYLNHQRPDGYVISEEAWLNVHPDNNDALYARIKYISDGNQVVALVGKPHRLKGKAPVIIYNRGGNREFAKIERPNKLIYRLIQAGFIVLASQYRGNDGGTGKEEFGGADVRDVFNLYKVAQNRNDCDMNNIFMIGTSRGGMMTYLAIKDGMKLKGAAVIGGLCDLFEMSEYDPQWEKNVLAQLIPDYSKHKKIELTKRSATCWPEKLTVPLLIQHGTDDERVSHDQAFVLAYKLKAMNRNILFLSYKVGHTINDEMIEDLLWWLGTFRYG